MIGEVPKKKKTWKTAQMQVRKIYYRDSIVWIIKHDLHKCRQNLISCSFLLVFDRKNKSQVLKYINQLKKMGDFLTSEGLACIHINTLNLALLQPDGLHVNKAVPKNWPIFRHA